LSGTGLPEDLKRRIHEAREASDWSTLAEIWEGVLEVAVTDGDGDLAREASIRVADALRRDDRPAATLKALRRSMDLVDQPALRALQEIQIVGSLMDAGYLDVAEQLARERVAACDAGPVRTIALDTLAGVLMARGDVIGLKGVVARLGEEARGPAAISARFRAAQVARIDGRLGEAAEELGGVAETLANMQGGEGGEAAAWGELGELCLMRGDADHALTFFDKSARAWGKAGRRVGLFTVEAGRSMAAVASGATTFLPGLLDEPVHYAEERGMPMLEARLRLARGLCRHLSGSEVAEVDLKAAALLADTAGAPWLAGRIRLEGYRYGLLDVDELKTAVEQLTGNQPLYARAVVNLADALLETEPTEALHLAATALARLSFMDLPEDEEAARGVLARARR
jgi:hypothetical protein